MSKVNLGLQQYLGEFGLSYRVLQAPQGWFDILAGFRFTYLGNQMGLQANQTNINTASTDLVNLFAQQITTPGSNLNTLIRQTIQSRLGSLADRNPGLPVPPLAGRQPGPIVDFIRGLIQSRRPELASAIQAGVQARVNQLKIGTGKCDCYWSNKPAQPEFFSLRKLVRPVYRGTRAIQFL